MVIFRHSIADFNRVIGLCRLCGMIALTLALPTGAQAQFIITSTTSTTTTTGPPIVRRRDGAHRQCRDPERVSYQYIRITRRCSHLLGNERWGCDSIRLEQQRVSSRFVAGTVLKQGYGSRCKLGVLLSVLRHQRAWRIVGARHSGLSSDRK